MQGMIDMYNRDYENGLHDGRMQGHQAGYAVAESEWRKKGEAAGYDYAWGEANEVIGEKNDIIYNLNLNIAGHYQHAQSLETYIAQLKDYIDQQAASLRQAEDEVRALQARNTALEETVLQSAKQTRQRSLDADELRTALDAKNIAVQANTVLLSLFNHSMLVTSAAFSAFEGEDEALADGHRGRGSDGFAHRYAERLEHAMSTGIIKQLPPRDPHLQAWAPEFNDQLMTLYRRALRAVEMQAHLSVTGRFPDLVRALEYREGQLLPIPVEAPSEA